MNSAQETQLGHELRQLVSDQPFTPDTQAIGLRARQQHRRGLALRGATAAGAAVFLAAGGLFAAVHGTAGGAAGTTAPRTPAVGSRLVTLAAAIKASHGNLPGNASLVIQTQTLNGIPPEVTYNLYTDRGGYYGANNKKNLTAAVDHHENLAGSWLDARQVVAAARYAATGDLTAAQERMLNATPNQFERLLRDSPAARKKLWEKDMAKARAIFRAKHAKPPAVPTDKILQADIDYSIWYNSVNALTEGAGNPHVREGVLRLLSTIPEITVANSTTNGQATLTLTAGPALNPGSGLPAQVVTISAGTGMPISSVWGTPGQKYYSHTTFQVSRVRLADVRAGQF
jgi:hypothetical protein